MLEVAAQLIDVSHGSCPLKVDTAHVQPRLTAASR